MHPPPLIATTQLLVASPDYLNKVGVINKPEYLKKEDFIGTRQDNNTIYFLKETAIKVAPRFWVDDSSVSLDLARQGYGYTKTNAMLAKKLIETGELVSVLEDYQLPPVALYAKTLAKEQQPAKVSQCLEILTEHFSSAV